MREHYEVAIVGAGTAGLAALREVRKRTDNFVVINDGPYGTTCARVGCMPSKALIEAANAYHRREHFAAFGIHGAEHLAVDIPAVLRRVRSLRDGFVKGTLKATDDLGERNIPGRAKLDGPNVVVVDGRRIQADRIILATGSRPHLPAEWSPFQDHILTSDSLFEQESLPPRMAVIGLGAIGAEMAQALARLGIEVTAFTRSPRVGGLTDPEMQEVAFECLGTELTIHRGEAATLEAADGGVRVTADGESVVVDKVLAALGRRANLDKLGLDTLGVELDRRGLPPYDPETLQVADLPVFIAGDVNGHRPILHEAADDGHIAGNNATAADPGCYIRRTPLHIVFTDPNIAVVGASWQAVKEREPVIGEVSFARHGRARTAEKNRGALRVYADNASGALLGAEICAPSGEHLAHLIALAIQQRLSVHAFLAMPFYHPVIEEGLRAALRRASKQLPGAPASDLSACGEFNAEALD